MSQTNTVDQLNGLFKETYADKVEHLVPEGVRLRNMVDFQSAAKQPGNIYHQPVVLTHEHGFTYGGVEGDAFLLNNAKAGVMRDAQIRGHEMVLRSYLSIGAVSRSSNDKAAFVQATKLLVENMLKSFARRLEVQLMYGQEGLAEIESISGTVLSIEKEEFSPGIWSGGEGMLVQIYSDLSDSATLRGEAEVTAVSLDDRSVTLNSLPAGTTAGDHIFYKGAKGSEFAGLHKIITNTGSLFNISAASYNLWKGSIVDVGSDFAGNEAVLSFAKVEEAIARAVEKGLADDKMTVLVNPRSWNNLLTEQAAKRQYDTSWDKAKVMNGSQAIEFYGQNGTIEIVSSIYVKEGFAYAFPKDDYMRIGSSDITFEMPGFEDKFFRLLENANGYELRAYTDQALFCRAPGRSVLLRYIKSEA
jgi:hypothetical protein